MMALKQKAVAVLVLLLLNVVTLSFGAAMGLLGLALAACFLVLSVFAGVKILHA